jgi:hypothetical protein
VFAAASAAILLAIRRTFEMFIIFEHFRTRKKSYLAPETLTPRQPNARTLAGRSPESATSGVLVNPNAWR